ncbi:hypothetical protein [Prescottella subtropica]|uniref:hypothetical protein n=1 Tax=Prescottella subtropica TaxID=2545757 RepID=UPI0013876055|nr:hypothetical protein [Prescottella subtropica]
MKRKTVGGDEVDAFSRRRHAHNWKPGERKAIKTGANRRLRREGRDEARREAAAR